jgi:hypothetical protein
VSAITENTPEVVVMPVAFSITKLPWTDTISATSERRESVCSTSNATDFTPPPSISIESGLCSPKVQKGLL